METEVTQKAMGVLIDVLERFAFALGDPADPAEIAPPAEPACLARMTFSGPFTGSLALLMPAALGGEIAANMLGLDPGDPALERHATDAIKEILNVVCGNLLTELAGEDPVFDLSVPTVDRGDPAAWARMLGQPGLVCILVEEWPVLLQLQFEGVPL